MHIGLRVIPPPPLLFPGKFTLRPLFRKLAVLSLQLPLKQLDNIKHYNLTFVYFTSNKIPPSSFLMPLFEGQGGGGGQIFRSSPCVSVGPIRLMFP